MSFKILSMDGGGAWSLIQARVLMDIYGDIPGHELLRQFDMVIANSGGSLVLASLCNDMKPSEIIEIFANKANREQVFSKLTFWEKLNRRNVFSLSSVLGPKYSAARKWKGLVDILKAKDHFLAANPAVKPVVETPLNELPTLIKKDNLQLLIVGFDYFRKRAVFFRSNENSLTNKFSKYSKISLADAIHASSNAPVNYFDAPAQASVHLAEGSETRTQYYWDGAVSGFNNPVLAGMIEAITNNPDRNKAYCILSLGSGTGSRPAIADYQYSNNPAIKAIYELNKNNPLADTDARVDFLKDIKKMSTSILGDPPDSATFITYAILDPSLSREANLVRINPCINPDKDANGKFILPLVYRNDANGLQKFITLMDMDMDAIEDSEVKLIAEFCDRFMVLDQSPCISNQLIRGDVANGDNYLGQATYKEAKAKWQKCISS
ncbi:MAG: patatin-like phospholipase family protein [Sphingobacteriaceae bacterium]